jgi:hypothetical protein
MARGRVDFAAKLAELQKKVEDDRAGTVGGDHKLAVSPTNSPTDEPHPLPTARQPDSYAASSAHAVPVAGDIMDKSLPDLLAGAARAEATVAENLPAEEAPGEEVASRAYRVQGVLLYPDDYAKADELEFAVRRRRLRIPGKKGLSLIAATGIRLLYELYERDPDAAIAAMRETGLRRNSSARIREFASSRLPLDRRP